MGTTGEHQFEFEEGGGLEWLTENEFIEMVWQLYNIYLKGVCAYLSMKPQYQGIGTQYSFYPSEVFLRARIIVT